MTTTTAATSSPTKFEPRTNVFLLVNLGCEMLYVIDQRLKAQQISKDKSIQVVHDITAVMLEPKFIDSIILGSTHTNSQLLTVDHCKFMLNDIAICSLMRLDTKSMDKLWNLMTSIFKWQMFVARRQHHLLDITFRHLDGIAQLYPDEKRSQLIDYTKNTLLDFWNACGDDTQLAIYRTANAWLQCFNTKISLLIRLGFQALDGSFICDVDQSYYREFVDTIGVNIYEKSAEIAAQPQTEIAESNATRRMDQLVGLLNLQQTHSEDLKPIDASDVQQKFERSLQQCNILFDDLDGGGGEGDKPKYQQRLVLDSSSGTLDFNLFPDSTRQSGNDGGEFVQLPAIYNRHNTSDGSNNRSAPPVTSTSINGRSEVDGLHRELLKFYGNME